MNNSYCYENLTIEELIFQLDDPDGFEAAHARMELVQVGKPGVPALIAALSDPEDTSVGRRPEALPGNSEIPKLPLRWLKLYSDKCLDVRWAAAEALYPLEVHAIVPLLEDLFAHYELVTFRGLAHYVFRNLEKKGLLEEPVVRVFMTWATSNRN